MMLEATANFIGKDGFNWWVGQVENTGGTKQKDADYTNKVKVRIVGYHNPSKKELPTEDLPWAMVAFPATQPQRAGAGTNHQLVENGWVIGFFMDGSSAQIPIVFGSIGDENPQGAYKKTDDGSPFPQLVPPKYESRVHGEMGTMPPGTGPTVVPDTKTGVPKKPEEDSSAEDTSSSTNPRGPAEAVSDAMKAADKKKCYTVHVGNGKCGSEDSVKLEGALAEFMKFARGIEQNEIGEFIDQVTGDVVDFMAEVSNVASRIQAKMSGLLANIKGTVLKEVDLFIKDQLKNLNIPNPDLAGPVKAQLGNLGDLINCLFGQLGGDLLGFLKGMLMDLATNALDTALCLIQDMLGAIMGKVMGLINQAMSMLSGILGAITGAIGMIQGLLSKIGDFLDLFCDGAVSCAIGISTFETCQGAQAKGNDKKKKQEDQYKVKPPKNGEVVGEGKPNSKGYVPFSQGGQQWAFNTKTGEKIKLDTTLDPEGFTAKTGISQKSFDTRGPLEKFEDSKIYASDGSFNQEALNCDNSILNRKPCFPEMIFDNLQSTLPVKALPIIDDIGSIAGVLMQKKGFDVNLEASARAMFTCNEPEGSGAVFKPVIINSVYDPETGLDKKGIMVGVDVIKPGLGYGFDPADTFCPKEQYIALITPSDSTSSLEEGDFLQLIETAAGAKDPTQPDVLQVYDMDYNGEGKIAVATINPTFGADLQPGLIVATKDGVEIKINFTKKFTDLVVPPTATAVYAGCSDLIPVLENLKPINVGSKYTNPKVYIGIEDDKKEIGDAEVDDKGKITKVKLNQPVIGFSRPYIEDDTGSGAKLIGVYDYVGPIKLKQKLGTSTSYIDCVDHKYRLVGYVNGAPYYGLYHEHEGRKMTGPIHTSAPHDYIYDTIEESLSGTNLIASGSSTPSMPGVAGETTTTTINTTAGGISPVADVQTIINTGTTTPAPSPTPSPSPSPDPGGGGGSTPGYGY